MLAKKFALGFGIAVIFPMMIHYGVSTFTAEPRWENYSVKNYYVEYRDAAPAKKAQLKAQQDRLQAKWKQDQKSFQRNLFSFAAPLGIFAIAIGSLIPLQAIGAGLMFGGIFSVLDGYFNFWPELPDGIRFLSLLIAFFVLIYIGFRKLVK